jgi:hypothetical protein
MGQSKGAEFGLPFAAILKQLSSFFQSNNRLHIKHRENSNKKKKQKLLIAQLSL